MKKAWIMVMLFSLLLLPGCGTGGEEKAWKKISEQYSGVSAVEATAKITADSGVWMEYEVQANYQDGACTTTILSPEELAGISGVVRGSAAELTFEGVSLDTLLPAVAGFTPMDCIDGMLRTLGGAVPTEENRETKEKEKCLVLTYEQPAGEYTGSKRIWISEKTNTPIYMELYLGDDRILHCDFTAFTMQ
ncbi:hypothetical protein [Acidaminobacterium chupaoyuni]